MKFSQQVRQSVGGDEYYSPQNVVDMIVPHIIRGGYRSIWCPFDKAESKFVKVIKPIKAQVVLDGQMEIEI